MRCPSCKRKHNKLDGLRCQCGYAFVFADPATQQLSDEQFCTLLDRATRHGMNYVIPAQIYYYYHYHKRKPARLSRLLKTLIACCGGALAVAIVLDHGWLLPLIIVLVVLSIALRLSSQQNMLDQPQFNALLDRWREFGDPSRLSNVLFEPRLGSPPPEWSESDIYDYGVERILLVEHDILVDSLVLNELHANERALVLSESGYPNYLFPIAKQLLEEREDLPVFLLHDATPSGAGMRQRVEKSGLLPLAGHPVVDLGLSRPDVEKIKPLASLVRSSSSRALKIEGLPYGMLSVALAAGFANELALGESLAKIHQKGGGGSDLEWGFEFG